VALIIALLVSLAFEDYGGNALLGTTWLALGYMLWSRSGATSTPLRGRVEVSESNQQGS
jgi:hypothetical protein